MKFLRSDIILAAFLPFIDRVIHPTVFMCMSQKDPRILRAPISTQRSRFTQMVELRDSFLIPVTLFNPLTPYQRTLFIPNVVQVQMAFPVLLKLSNSEGSLLLRLRVSSKIR